MSMKNDLGEAAIRIGEVMGTLLKYREDAPEFTRDVYRRILACIPPQIIVDYIESLNECTRH